MQCHYRLAFDEDGLPMFYVFNTCKNFIRTIPLLLYDEKKVEDIDTSLEDHIYDEWRYVMMENPINPPIRQKTIRDVREDPLDLWKDSYTDNIGRYDYITY
jgi:nitrate reductase beta subunit